MKTLANYLSLLKRICPDSERLPKHSNVLTDAPSPSTSIFFLLSQSKSFFSLPRAPRPIVSSYNSIPTPLHLFSSLHPINHKRRSLKTSSFPPSGRPSACLPYMLLNLFYCHARQRNPKREDVQSESFFKIPPQTNFLLPPLPSSLSPCRLHSTCLSPT